MITGFSFSELQPLTSNASATVTRSNNDNLQMTPVKTNYIVNRLKELGCEGITHRLDLFMDATLFYVKKPFGGFAVTAKEDKTMHGKIWRHMIEQRIQEYLDKAQQ